jgi:S-adenosylmethionine hydrolase
MTDPARPLATPVPIVSLTTDFGERDEYVGVMKGVILTGAPGTQIVDLCHRIAPQSVPQAAFLIAAAFGHFPPGTLHLVVVDPGVGGTRRILYAEAAGHRFICPDNGLLGRIDQQAGLNRVRQVTNDRLFKPTVGHTFHGRDIMAPVAAFLAGGGAPDRLGDEISTEAIVRLRGWQPRRREDGRIAGRIVAVDRFGNLITNIDAHLLGPGLQTTPHQVFDIDIGRRLTTHLHTAYEEALPGKPLAIIGSRETLEIAVNQGSAQAHYRVAAGDSVIVQPTPAAAAGAIDRG